MAPFFSLSEDLFLPFLFLFLISFSHTYGIQHPLCDDGDRSSLLEFKKSFVFGRFYCYDPSTDYYTKLTSWNVSHDCCSWDGVHCDDQTGHVVRIDLSNSCLFGSINSSSPLFRLVHLKSLDLSYNNFNLSRIPREIRSLTELKHLNLSSSNFSGQIPSEILELSKLVSVLLSGNPLMLQKPSLKDMAETLTKLIDLQLSGVNISSHVPRSLSNLTSLRTLFLRECSLQGEFPPAIFQLPNLRDLSLRYNPDLIGYLPEFQVSSPLETLSIAGTNFHGQIPLSIGKLKSLSSFDASECGFGGKIPSSIGNLTKLDYLDLSNNNFSGQLPLSIGNLKSLWYFDASECGFGGKIPSSIGNLTKLYYLDLSNNSFSGELPLSIGNLKSLWYFHASECGFGGKIPSSIGNLTKLEILYLTNNYFSGNIPSSLGNLLQLTDLSLAFNNFTSGTLHWLHKLTNLQNLDLVKTNSNGTIPDSFQNLTQLQELWLRGNQLTGQIPYWIGNSTHLTTLELQKNELQGPIPDSIFRLPKIQVIALQYNNLSGSLRYDSFLQSKYLYNLQLSYNHVSLVSNAYNNVTLPKFQILALSVCNLAEFPSFLHGQNELQMLELSDNKIKGYVPNWISSLESLVLLGLANNSLTGFEQPLSLLSLPNLDILEIQNNEFKGRLPIPPPSIKTYRASQNKFTGDVPQSFCNLRSPEELDLSSNNLSGNLPSCLGNNVSVLNLRNNSLSGEIPNQFTSGCLLKVMDLSQNLFEGKAPNSLANCSNLEILNFEENQIDDGFPSWLGILPHLRVVSLKSNKFHGPIGKPLSQSEFGRLQIIDLSHNYFTGKLPFEYFRNWIAMKYVDDDHLGYMHTNTSFQVPNWIYSLEYTYSIRIMNKGIERAFEQILEFFVLIDLSSNKFEGEIPEIISTLRELKSLNLSNNLLTGHIPSSLGNLTNLETLDLSLNNLSGVIPTQLALLTFLAKFNVSHNSLTGQIPGGRQFDTFDNDSFSDNQGLCGLPLSIKCGNSNTLPLPPSEDDEEGEESPFEWNWKIVVMGFGSGLVIGVSYGYAMDTRKYEWLVRRRFARWSRNRRNF